METWGCSDCEGKNTNKSKDKYMLLCVNIITDE